jgi:hypothetical protein
MRSERERASVQEEERKRGREEENGCMGEGWGDIDIGWGRDI